MGTAAVAGGELVVVIDDREKTPWTFPGTRTTTKRLLTGDYQITDTENRIADNKIVIERKASITEWLSSASHGRTRIEEEWRRFLAFPPGGRHLVFEFRLSALDGPYERSLMHPRAAWESTVAFCVRFGIAIHFCENRTLAERWALSLLRRVWRDATGTR